ncbi:uncharacterized protein LOC123388169 isoform X1 [Mustela putorius furo]|uniref:Uncharacterized protein LOC123388169 isoform X1 n=1 Tax=Mustela putorius furo TaxID=9669 RepID=A0A8U0UPK7_MUSPF|nr:uncharacterized protein LOC123388169 isoform X1 [Mustela putorius furo]
MGNLNCCCTEICGECLPEDVELPPPTPTPPRRRHHRRRKKRVRFSLHDEVCTFEDTEEDPVENQSKELPRGWTKEGPPTLPEVDAGSKDSSLHNDLMEELLPTLRAEEETLTLPQEAATGYIPYAYSPIIPFRGTDLTQQGRAFSPPLVWRASPLLSYSQEWRLGRTEQTECPAENQDPVLQSLQTSRSFGRCAWHFGGLGLVFAWVDVTGSGMWVCGLRAFRQKTSPTEWT